VVLDDHGCHRRRITRSLTSLRSTSMMVRPAPESITQPTHNNLINACDDHGSVARRKGSLHVPSAEFGLFAAVEAQEGLGHRAGRPRRLRRRRPGRSFRDRPKHPANGPDRLSRRGPLRAPQRRVRARRLPDDAPYRRGCGRDDHELGRLRVSGHGRHLYQRVERLDAADGHVQRHEHLLQLLGRARRRRHAHGGADRHRSRLLERRGGLQRLVRDLPERPRVLQRARPPRSSPRRRAARPRSSRCRTSAR
jgi:hypothetical protein